jgi:hypothetical protein
LFRISGIYLPQIAILPKRFRVQVAAAVSNNLRDSLTERLVVAPRAALAFWPTVRDDLAHGAPLKSVRRLKGFFAQHRIAAQRLLPRDQKGTYQCDRRGMEGAVKSVNGLLDEGRVNPIGRDPDV